MLEGVSLQPGPAPVDSHSESVVRCPICGAGVDGADSVAVARGLGWVELPGVWLCPDCAGKPDVWATIGVEVSPAGGDHSVVRVVGIPVLYLPHEQAHSEGVSLRSSLAAFVNAAMTAARRG
jgi:rubredoxin